MPRINKAYALSNAKIQFVSLVDKAANKRQFLITKAEGNSANFQSFGKIVKADSESHFVTGIVYEPMAEDTDGEYMVEAEIEKAAHWYMKNAGNVDIQHCFNKAGGIDVVESSVTKCDMELEGTLIKKGTWLMTVEVTDPDVWDSIQKGDITGFSMGGVASRSEEDVDLDTVEKAKNCPNTLETAEIQDSFVGKLAKAIKEAFASDKQGNDEVIAKGEMAQRYNRRARNDNFITAWNCLRDSLEGYSYNPATGSYEWGYSADEKQIREALEDFNAIVTQLLTSDNVVGEIEKAAKESGVAKAGRSLSSKNLNALKDICGNLQSFLDEFETSDESGDEGDGAEIEKNSTIKKEEDKEMKKSEVEAIVSEVVKSAVEPLAEAIKDLSKSDDNSAPDAKDVAKGEDSSANSDEVSAEVVKSMVSEELTKALAPINQQIESIKKSRAVPTNLDDEPRSDVSKGEQHYLHGIL